MYVGEMALVPKVLLLCSSAKVYLHSTNSIGSNQTRWSYNPKVTENTKIDLIGNMINPESKARNPYFE